MNEKQMEKIRWVVDNIEPIMAFINEAGKRNDLVCGNMKQSMVDYIVACFNLVELRYFGYQLMLGEYKKDDIEEFKAKYRDDYKQASDKYSAAHDKAKDILDVLNAFYKEIENVAVFQLPENTKDSAA